jgi:hypothetical protein
MNMRLPQLNAHELGRLVDLNRRTVIYIGPLYGIKLPGLLTVLIDKLHAINCLRGTSR